MRIKKFIINFYLFKFITDFALIYPVYLIYFKLKGLNTFEISIILSIWCATVILLEIPTGAFADRWNRQYILIIGLISKALCFFIWLYAKNLILFGIGFIFWGIQETFTSGTLESLLYDNLKTAKIVDQYEKIAGHGQFYSKIGASLAFLGGSIIAYFNYNIILIISSITMITGIIPIFFLKEIKNKTPTCEIKYLVIIKNAIKESINNKNLFKLILYTFVYFGIIGVIDEYIQIYLQWAKLPIFLYGIALIFTMVLQSIGNKLAYKFSKIFKNDNNIFYLSLISGAFLLISVLYQSIFLIPFFILIFFLCSIGEIIIENRIQKEISKNSRATILSINSLMFNLSALIYILIFGVLSKIYNIKISFIFFAVILIYYSITSLLINIEIK